MFPVTVSSAPDEFATSIAVKAERAAIGLSANDGGAAYEDGRATEEGGVEVDVVRELEEGRGEGGGEVVRLRCWLSSVCCQLREP